MQKYLKAIIPTVLSVSMLVSSIVPKAYSKAVGEISFESEIEQAQLLTPMLDEFEVGNNDFVATSVVQGHDYLYVPHNSKLFVYDLDTFEKVDEEDIDMPETDGAFVDSNGIVWVYGQTSSLDRYDPIAQTGYKTKPFRGNTNTNKTHVYYPIEVGNELYVGTYNEGRLASYKPPVTLFGYTVSGDSFTDLGILVEGGVKMTTIAHKNGYLYASVHAADSTQLPHVLIKYEIATGKVVGSLDLKEAGVMESVSYLTQTIIVGDVLLGATAKHKKMMAVDINTMEMVDIGVSKGIAHGFSQVITDENGNEKVYFLADGKVGLDLYEYNSGTGKATKMDGFDPSTVHFNTRGNSFVTIEAEGLSGESMLVGMKTNGTLALYNMETGKLVEVEGLTTQDSAAIKNIDFRSGPAGSNEIYVGSFMSNIAAVYDIKTNTITKKYSAYSDQVETSIWFNDTWYVSGYGACSVSEMDYDTGEYKVLFSLNEGSDRLSLVQERIHTITAGGNKVFGATVPHKNILGGFIAWYDYETQTTFVAVEDDKVIYRTDADKSVWRDAKTNQEIVFNTDDNGANDFAGVIENQVVNSLHYHNGYLYGTTYIGGGSGSTPAEGATAEIFVYDVDNMQLVYHLPISHLIKGLVSPVELVSAFVADPEIPGKYWGVVAQTLFTATFDHNANAFQVEEVASYGKESYRGYIGKFKSGQIYFRNGYAILNFRGHNPEKPGANDTVDTLRIIDLKNPQNSYILSTQAMGAYVLGEDDNLYYLKNNGVSVLYTADVIERITGNQKVIAAVMELIDRIDPETALQNQAQVIAVRAAYEELTEEQKGLVSNISILLEAEQKLAERNKAHYAFVDGKGKTIKVRTWGDGGTYTEPMFADSNPKLSIAEGTNSWTFAGRSLSGMTGSADGTRVNINQTSLLTYFTESNASSSTNGDWIALKLENVPAGTYQMSFVGAGSETNNGLADVFIMPEADYAAVYADYMSLKNDENAPQVRTAVNEGMKTLLSGKTALGVLDSRVSGAQNLGEYTCETQGDYIVVFRCSANQTGNCRLALISMDMIPQYVVQENVVARIGEQTYTSLKSAMENAKPGETVSLQMTTATGSLDVPAGVILDLNGFTVMTSEMFSAGHIVDSSEDNSGMLCVPDLSGINESNKEVPIYDSAVWGYRFFKISVASKAVTGRKAESAKYWFQVNIENFELASELIGENELAIGVQLVWDGQENLTVAVANADFAGKWLAAEAEAPGNYIVFTATGITEEFTNFRVIPVVGANGVYSWGEELK